MDQEQVKQFSEVMQFYEAYKAYQSSATPSPTSTQSTPTQCAQGGISHHHHHHHHQNFAGGTHRHSPQYHVHAAPLQQGILIPQNTAKGQPAFPVGTQKIFCTTCGFWTDHDAANHHRAQAMKSNEQDSKGGFNPAFLTCESCGKTDHNFMNCDKLDPAMAAFVLSKKKDEDDRKEMAKAQVNAALAAKGYDVSQFRFNNWGKKGSQTRIVSAPKSQMGQPAAQPAVLPSAPCSHGPPEGLYPAAPPPSGAAAERVMEGPSLDGMLEMIRSLGYVVTKETPSTASTTQARDPATEQEKEKAGAAPAQHDIDPLTTVPETQLDVRGRDSTGSVASDGSSKAAAVFVSESPINVDG